MRFSILKGEFDSPRGYVLFENKSISDASKNHYLAGQGALIICAIFWSTSGLFIKLLDWHPVVIYGVRSSIAAVFMLCVRFFQKPVQKTENKKYPLWAGAFAYSFVMLGFVVANKLTTAANAIMLQYSAPVWAALLGWLLIKEKPRKEHWAALVMIFAGFFIFFRDGLTTGAFLGDGVAILSGIFFGAHSVFMRMQKDANPADSMLLSHLISLVISIPFIIIYPPQLSASTVFPIIFMGVIQIGCSSLLYSFAIKRISAVQAMLTATIEPLLNPVWVLAITGEKPTTSALIGGGIILTAVIVTQLPVIASMIKTRKLADL